MAAKLTVQLREGKTMDVFAYKDLITPEPVVRGRLKRDLSLHVQDVINFEMRENDVFLATYQKSGTHWVWEATSMLINGNASHIKTDKEALFFDIADQSILTKMAEAPSPRIINSHYTPRCLPKDIVAKGIKVVHVYRNPKDVCVSQYHHAKKLGSAVAESWEMFFKCFTGAYGVYVFYSWAHYMKEWEYFAKQHPQQILGIYFEDMKEDPVREILKINEFLGCNRSEELVKEIADSCSFDKMKQADQNKQHTFKNPDNLIYRKGEVGDWKNWLTVEQNEQMDEWLAENFTNTDFKFRYTL